MEKLLAGHAVRQVADVDSERRAILAASQLAAVVKLVYTQASGACGLYARGGSSPLSRTTHRPRAGAARARCYAGRRAAPCRYRLGD